MNVTWTENQRIILHSYGTPDERLEQNALMPVEEQLAALVPQAEDYLAQRYPGRSFTFLRVGGNMLSANTHVLTVVDGESQGRYNITATRAQPGADLWQLSDDFYAAYKSSEVAAYLGSLFEAQGISPIRPYVRLIGSYGQEFDPAASVEQLIDAGLSFHLTGEIYTTGLPVSEALGESLAAALAHHGLSGGVTLVTLVSLPDGPADSTWLQAQRAQTLGKVFIPLTLAASDREEKEE